MVSIQARLTSLERRIRPAWTAPQGEPFDFDAYRAAWDALEARTPEELAAECAGVLDATDWPAPVPGRPFDWAAFAMISYEIAAGSPPGWREMVNAARSAP